MPGFDVAIVRADSELICDMQGDGGGVMMMYLTFKDAQGRVISEGSTILIAYEFSE